MAASWISSTVGRSGSLASRQKPKKEKSPIAAFCRLCSLIFEPDYFSQERQIPATIDV
jgi:hypothetical protein